MQPIDHRVQDMHTTEYSNIYFFSLQTPDNLSPRQRISVTPMFAPALKEVSPLGNVALYYIYHTYAHSIDSPTLLLIYIYTWKSKKNSLKLTNYRWRYRAGI